jgi:hypothetical protein
LACAKVLTILSMAGRYNKPVQCGRESAHKSRAQGEPASLDDCMNTIQHIRSTRSMRPSVGTERSQLLQILPSLTLADAYVRRTPSFSVRQYFLGANVFTAPRFLYAPMFFVYITDTYIFVYFASACAELDYSQLPDHQNSLMAARAIPLSACRLGPPSGNGTRK